MKKNKLSMRLLIIIVVLSVAVAALFPLFWMFISSFKKNADIIALPLRFWPTVWTTENYELILLSKNFDIGSSLRYTLALTVLFTFLTLTVNAVAAYGFARLEFPGKTVLWALVMITMFIPSISTLVTSYTIVAKMGMVNTIWVLIIPGLASGGMIFFIRQFYLNFPLSLEEAGLVDGSTPMKNLLYIFLPASGPVFVIQGVGSFLGFWNNYLWPAITISDEQLYPIMLTLQFFKAQRAMKDGAVLAGSVITSLPPIILFLIFQRHIIEGIKMSGLK